MKTITLICLSTILVGCAGVQGEIKSFEKRAVQHALEVVEDINEDTIGLQIDLIKGLTDIKKKKLALEKERDDALREYLSIDRPTEVK